ncbi:MAG: GlsB/YeaQ/YmgE family stress response membrane protein [Pseudomonadales bacterium]
MEIAQAFMNYYSLKVYMLSRQQFRLSPNTNGVMIMQHGFIAWLVIGGIAGWLAGVVVKGGGFGLVVDIIVGIVGAFIGGWLAGVLGISLGGGLIGSIVTALIGAVILLFIIRLIKRG